MSAGTRSDLIEVLRDTMDSQYGDTVELHIDFAQEILEALRADEPLGYVVGCWFNGELRWCYGGASWLDTLTAETAEATRKRMEYNATIGWTYTVEPVGRVVPQGLLAEFLAEAEARAPNFLSDLSRDGDLYERVVAAVREGSATEGKT